MTPKKKSAFWKFWAHNPEIGQSILNFGKRNRKLTRQFNNGRAEIAKLQKSGK